MKPKQSPNEVLLVLDCFDDLNKADSSDYGNKSSQGFKSALEKLWLFRSHCTYLFRGSSVQTTASRRTTTGGIFPIVDYS